MLVFAYGNPSRGDDALGPSVYEFLRDYFSKHAGFDTVELLTDFQLLVEHAVDLDGVDEVIFVDANLNCDAPYVLENVPAEKDHSYSTHALHPRSVLAVYEQIYHRQAPPASLLNIRGYEFRLGQSVSKQAKENLDQSLVYLLGYLKTQLGLDSAGSV